MKKPPDFPNLSGTLEPLLSHAAPWENPLCLSFPLQSGQKRSILCGEGMLRIEIPRELGLRVPGAALREGKVRFPGFLRERQLPAFRVGSLPAHGHLTHDSYLA